MDCVRTQRIEDRAKNPSRDALHNEYLHLRIVSTPDWVVLRNSAPRGSVADSAIANSCSVIWSQARQKRGFATT